MLRVQRGSDLQELSDGLLILVDDVPRVRAALSAALADGGADGGADGAAEGADAGAGGGVRFSVGLSPGIRPPGSPSVPPAEVLADPPIVHMVLYLQRTCHAQNTNLHAVRGTATFRAIFSGNRDERTGADRLTDATFDVEMGDLRDTPLGSDPRDIPVARRSHVTGSLRFYFERGQPAQPFP